MIAATASPTLGSAACWEWMSYAYQWATSFPSVGRFTMSLSSVLNTARTALSAAEMGMGVIANNLANVQTNGFKASRTVFTAGHPVTYGLGAAPSGRSGGTNPIQVGTGVQLAAISTDFRQGSLVLSSDPLDMAIEGDGFFILQGSSGEQLFSRSGDFHVNADGEIVSATGYRLLGYSVDANFQLNRAELAPLKLPAGSRRPRTRVWLGSVPTRMGGCTGVSRTG